MRSSEKVRILVYFVFFVAVIVLAALYRPADAYSRPGHQSNPMVQNN